ncbi:MAG: YkgJ family cysteine cluster protein [Deltaproteobacteria bacterium]|nr:YkgJ family cysteine cluster protein [Deltaproteobacteria bacterium]
MSTAAFVLLALAAVSLIGRGALPRLLWRELMRLFVLLELGAMQLVRLVYPPRFVLRGRCQRRGACCRHVIADPPAWIAKTALLPLFVAYHRVAHRFHLVGRGPEGVLVFRCGHLTAADRCGIYRYRPLLCRNYPVLGFFEAPHLLPGCGLVAVPRVVDLMRPRPGLAIVNPHVAVHHGTAAAGSEPDASEYLLVDDPPASERQ